MSELKPCPFCGGEAAYTQILGNYGRPHEVYCSTCDGGITEGRSKDGVIHNWNARPIEDDLRNRIAELEAERRWIPVSERLPETYKPVLTVDMSEATQIPVPAFYNPDTKCWSTHFKYDLWVTHWMRLPEPPIVYGKVCER